MKAGKTKYDKGGMWCIRTANNTFVADNETFWTPVSRYASTWFPTKAEAEAAMERLKIDPKTAEVLPVAAN